MKTKKLKYPNLNDLTIFIKTYNRPKFIVRTMKYWSSFNVKLVVLDGSKLPIESHIIEKLSKNISYVHYPTSIHHRMLFGLRLIKTEFVIMGADDEFFIPSALDKCIKMLKNNDELVSCIGRAMKFNFKNNQTTAKPVYPLLKFHKLVDEDPMKRIKEHFSNYIPRHCYSVCRSNFWKLAWEQSLIKEYNFFASDELYFEFLITFSNKSIAIPELMWARSEENASIRSTNPSMSNNYFITDWWCDEKYKKEKKEFLNKVELACEKISKINKKSYQPDVIGAFEILINFFKYDYPKLFKKGLFSYPLNLLHLIFKKLPNFIKILVRITFRFLGFKLTRVNELPFFDHLKTLENDGVKIDYHELNFIEKNIRLFHLNKNN